jgi:hypothetical protein
MISKRLIIILASIALISGFTSNVFAELFSFGVGIPVQHTFTSEWEETGDNVESDGTSGAFVHVKFPIMLGVGFETYQTNLKEPNDEVDDMSLTINMIDVFWLTPIPIINFTVGAGLGTTALNCEYADGNKCSDKYKDPSFASAYQWYLQLGYEFLPFLDAHVSYHNVTAKATREDDSDPDAGETSSFNGNVIGVGVSFIF